jgi:hypothetical protein
MSDSSYVSLVVRGPADNFYLIPVEDLAKYSHDLTPEKAARLESLIEQSHTNGRAVDAFYHTNREEGNSFAIMVD